MNRNIAEDFATVREAENRATRQAALDRIAASHAELVAALEAAREELRLIRLKDCDRVYNPTLGAQITLALAQARGEPS